MRAALYHRVSTLDQDKTLARGELRAAAKRRQAKVVLEVEESGSGSRNDRPGLQRVLDAARAGKLDMVMVWKLDRWGRSVLDVLGNIRALETAGVWFVSMSQGLEVRPGGDAASKLLLNTLAAAAEFQLSLIRDNTKLGMARARERGARIGRPKVPRPDVEAVRKAMLAREAKYPRSRLPEVAKQLRCTLHALKEVLPEATCAERRHSWTRDGERCRRGGEKCKGCRATVCAWHRKQHICKRRPPAAAAAPVKKGTLSRAASSRSSRRSPRGKGDAEKRRPAPSRKSPPAARLKTHPFSTAEAAAQRSR